MKAITFCTLLMTFLAVQPISANVISDDIPQKVKDAFASKFPSASDISWDAFGKEFIASFDNEGYYTEVTFKTDGTLVETATTLEETDLPENIMEQISDEFENFEYFNSIVLLEKPGKDDTFLINFDTEKQSVSMIFSDSGELLKKEVEDF